MFIELLLAIFAGTLLGTLSGLIPGLHINLIAVIMLGASRFLLHIFPPVALAALIVSMSITHTFVDFIPSIFLGAPESDTAFSALPGHVLLLKGLGFEAVKYTAIGGILCLIAVLALFPFLIWIVPFIYASISAYIVYLLIAMSAFIILKEKSRKRRFWCLNVFLLSGILGVIVLNMPVKEPLLPLLSGLFGISLLVKSAAEKSAIPPQYITETPAPKRKVAEAVSLGVFSGSLVSIFPALGPSHAAVLATQLFRKTGLFTYLIMIGGINTVSMAFALVTTYTIEKARNGSIVAVQQILEGFSSSELLILSAAALAAAGIAVLITLLIARLFCRIISRINYAGLCIAVIIFLFCLVTLFSGITGIIVLISSAAIGLVAITTNTPKSNAMGCLLLPVIISCL